MSKLEKIVLATRNQGKVKEFRALLAPLGIDVRSAADFPGLPEVIEDGNTFAENAVKKAGVISEALGCPALADDSGLCVDALNDRPGVFSARYAGENASDEENIKKLLQELHGVPEPERTARFVCVLALIVPGNEDIKAEGVCEGRIATEPEGRKRIRV